MAIRAIIKFSFWSRRCRKFQHPRSIEMFEWIVIPCGLKYIGVIDQMVMNSILYNIVDQFIDIYIDDVMIKSQSMPKHLMCLEKLFQRMRSH